MKVQAKIQKWGNSLGLRISGAMREMLHLQNGTKVDVEIIKGGFTVTKAEKRFPFKESDLLKGLSKETAHADLLAWPHANEVGES